MHSDDTPAVERFREDIEAVISTYCRAKALTNAETLGVLYLVMQDIANDEDDDGYYP